MTCRFYHVATLSFFFSQTKRYNDFFLTQIIFLSFSKSNYLFFFTLSYLSFFFQNFFYPFIYFKLTLSLFFKKKKSNHFHHFFTRDQKLTVFFSLHDSFLFLYKTSCCYHCLSPLLLPHHASSHYSPLLLPKRLALRPTTASLGFFKSRFTAVKSCSPVSIVFFLCFEALMWCCKRLVIFSLLQIPYGAHLLLVSCTCLLMVAPPWRFWFAANWYCCTKASIVVGVLQLLRVGDLNCCYVQVAAEVTLCCCLLMLDTKKSLVLP